MRSFGAKKRSGVSRRYKNLSKKWEGYESLEQSPLVLSFLNVQNMSALVGIMRPLSCSGLLIYSGSRSPPPPLMIQAEVPGNTASPFARRIQREHRPVLPWALSAWKPW